jgi:hypothetical protein
LFCSRAEPSDAQRPRNDCILQIVHYIRGQDRPITHLLAASAPCARVQTGIVMRHGSGDMHHSLEGFTVGSSRSRSEVGSYEDTSSQRNIVVTL